MDIIMRESNLIRQIALILQKHAVVKVNVGVESY